MASTKLTLNLSVFIMIAQIVVAQTVPTLDSSPKRKVEITLFNPTPEDWRKIHEHETVKILQILDDPDDGQATVDDQSLKNLSQFTNLRTLVISSNELTDAAIPQLLKLKHLEGLAVYGGKFTDEGIQKLKEMPAIQSIGFIEFGSIDTKLTDRGITQLQEAIPKAHVELGKYDGRGKLFDANGCPTSYFRKKHLKP